MKLISMVDFVLEQSESIAIEITFMEYSEIIIKYANFLNKPLELGMFVPCDEDGNVLKEKCLNSDYCECDCNKKYQQAKDRILFEGFEGSFVNTCVIDNKEYLYVPTEKISKKWLIEIKNKTIEDLVKYNLTLTPNAIKQLGL